MENEITEMAVLYRQNLRFDFTSIGFTLRSGGKFCLVQMQTGHYFAGFSLATGV